MMSPLNNGSAKSSNGSSAKKKFEQTPVDDQQKNFSGFTCLFAVMWLVGVIIAVLVIPEVFDRVNMWDVMVIGGMLTGSVVIGWLLMSRK